MAVTSGSMSVTAGREYDAWAGRLATGLKDLIAEGSAPEFSGLDRFLALSDRLRSAVRAGAERASTAGEPSYTIEVPFTDAEQRMLTDMGNTLLSFMEILTLRGKIDATPNAQVLEAIAAMTPPGG
jgi:hypothetical protein